jgi:glycosyltransferase involved in cell wall biosynthesis
VFHVVSYDVSRGAERYARALVDTLDERGPDRHLLMTIFQGDEQSLGADISLEVPRGLMRRGGFDPRAMRRMRRVFGEWKPRAVVAHGGEPAKYAAFATGDIPYAYLIIGSSHPLLNNPLRRLLRRTYIGRAAALVAVSNQLSKEVAREVGPSGPGLYVIPNGRDPEVYRPGKPSGRRVPHVLFVGHLDEQKRPHLFLHVMGEMSGRGVEATASIVGGGPLLEAIESAAVPLGIEALGPRDDVPALMADSDLLVLTSRPPEGMPGVLIEAGLAGLPVVTTDVPGARDVVVDGVTGRIVAVDDEGGLADAVESLLVDPASRASMGQAARERCLSEFSLDASARAWERVLLDMAT